MKIQYFATLKYVDNTNNKKNTIYQILFKKTAINVKNYILKENLYK